jgi:Methylamine utilisation protein MauE
LHQQVRRELPLLHQQEQELLPEPERVLTVGIGSAPVDADLAAVVLAARFAVGSLFALAGLAKLRDRAGFRQAVDGYQLLPDSLVGPFAAVLPVIELVIGAAIIAGVAMPQAASAVTVLLVGFAVAVTVNLLRGRDIDCGCSGAAGGVRISWRLVARNAALHAGAQADRQPGSRPGRREG